MIGIAIGKSRKETERGEGNMRGCNFEWTTSRLSVLYFVSCSSELRTVAIRIHPSVDKADLK